MVSSRERYLLVYFLRRYLRYFDEGTTMIRSEILEVKYFTLVQVQDCIKVKCSICIMLEWVLSKQNNVRVNIFGLRPT